MYDSSCDTKRMSPACTATASADTPDPMDLPPCQTACPVGTDIPGYAALIWNGELEAAVAAISATNPFSAICGRVCPAPCESRCKRAESDGAVTIRQLKRFAMDRLGADYHLPPVPVTRTRTIAIVGGGPAGLTAAQDLAEAGYAVHLHEAGDRLGGMMNAIPPFRLPANLLQQDIRRILAHCPGITVHYNSALGAQIDLATLETRHDAVLLTIGLSIDRPLTVPGLSPETAGVHGIRWMEAVARGDAPRLAGAVVVVGGGNVAMDMARAALRHGAESVDLFCLESRQEMPAWPHEIEQAVTEGVTLHNGWGPAEVLTRDGAVSGVVFRRCTSVFDDKGCFAPVFGKETRTLAADRLLSAIGLEARNATLADRGLLAQGRVPTNDALGRTAAAKVFAAGDCARGPSAIVQAMHEGHKAAFAIRGFLEGTAPESYRPAYRSRRIAPAPEAAWETLAREAPPAADAAAACRMDAECEAPFDPGMARRQAARCLRCDTETGTANYSRRARNLIQAMAATDPEDTRAQNALLRTLLQPRENPFPPGRPAHIDDVVFLSAALTRLVIDPYREACSTRTRITRRREVGFTPDDLPTLDLDHPLLFTGFDEAPLPVRAALAEGLAAAGCGYIGRAPLVAGTADGKPPMPWLQLLGAQDTPSAAAAGLVYLSDTAAAPVPLERRHPGQLLGRRVTARTLAAAIPLAIDQQLDFLLLDGSPDIGQPWAELNGHPDLTVIREAIRILRQLNMEEEIALLYFGGMRSGTDAAKVLALNCNAAVFSVAMALALDGRIDGRGIHFDSSDEAPLRQAVAHWIKGTSQEAAIIARCTGKTDVHNLEPEDMRCITLTTAEALGLPLASGQGRREWF
ncbi:FAD-dependent oxidoreductase [Desulfatitalea alkaliphila]|uniref:FAD-dependent oxidoreductase n=1 Tax=Desulfatitalea alkaliphila TaxID=2929485 RepID=A0AA41R0K2_9BACT|nr:FAD-dependent oxidoreductase [Desulfatitalea alkaliphila]MCJ8499719.1 FAD-dependent oxidoreductase [Desulfatitalea alkaliphila]